MYRNRSKTGVNIDVALPFQKFNADIARCLSTSKLQLLMLILTVTINRVCLFISLEYQLNFLFYILVQWVICHQCVALLVSSSLMFIL